MVIFELRATSGHRNAAHEAAVCYHRVYCGGFLSPLHRHQSGWYRFKQTCFSLWQEGILIENNGEFGFSLEEQNGQFNKNKKKKLNSNWLNFTFNYNLASNDDENVKITQTHSFCFELQTLCTPFHSDALSRSNSREEPLINGVQLGEQKLFTFLVT